ncbi:M14 family zinc carboxypeptidase [Deltaproteobacteria bacterium TL4]
MMDKNRCFGPHNPRRGNLMMLAFALFFLIVRTVPSALAADALQTPLEASNYQKMPKTGQVINFLQKLAQKYAHAQIISLGESAGKRPLRALLISKDPLFLRDHRTAEGMLSVMLTGSQHGTEPSGAEALQRIARTILADESHAYLNELNLIVIPVSNPDGFDLKKRVNAKEINLSTDYVRLSQPESQAMVATLKKFDPHVLLDVHESALLKKKSLGAQGFLTDFETQFEIANHPNIDSDLRDFGLNVFLPALLKAAKDRGLSASHYLGEITDINQSIKHGGLSLRNLRNYAGFWGTFSMTVENRLDPPGVYPTPRNIKVRADKQWLSVITFLEQLRSVRKDLLEKLQRTKNYWRSPKEDSSVNLVSYYAVHPAQQKIEISLRSTETGKLINKVFNYQGRIVSEEKIQIPLAYAVTAQHQFVAELLTHHQIQFKQLSQPKEVQGIRQRIKKLEITPPHSGIMKTEVNVSIEEETMKISLVPGDLWIDLNQPAGRLVPLILDPRSTSSVFQDPAETSRLMPAQPFFRVPLR